MAARCYRESETVVCPGVESKTLPSVQGFAFSIQYCRELAANQSIGADVMTEKFKAGGRAFKLSEGRAGLHGGKSWRIHFVKSASRVSWISRVVTAASLQLPEEVLTPPPR